MNPYLLAIKSCDLIRRHYAEDYDRVRKLIAIAAAEGRLIAIRRGFDVVGVAVVWPVDDPFDVGDLPMPPQPSARSRYAYLPLLYIAETMRRGPIIRELLEKALAIHPRLDRIAFRRTEAKRRGKRWGRRNRERIHVLKGLTHARSERDPDPEQVRVNGRD